MAGNLVTPLLNPTQTQSDLPGSASANYQHTTPCLGMEYKQEIYFFVLLDWTFFSTLIDLWVRSPTVAPGTRLNPSKMSIYKRLSLFDRLRLLGLAQSFCVLIGMSVKRHWDLCVTRTIWTVFK